MRLPRSRGPLSAATFDALRTDVRALEGVDASTLADSADDAAITLWSLHELHYRGFDDVADDLEWHPSVLGVRRQLEQEFERRLRDRYAGAPDDSGDLAADLFGYIEDFEGASVARHIQTAASVDDALELLRLKSIYHLKESDPVSWMLPRLSAVPKAALAELQYDEYGDGDPNRLHHEIFRRGLLGAGLDATYGAYIDETPLEVLEQNNAVSMFGLHRRLCPASAGHLAAFEATSSVPSRRIAQGLDRLGLGEEIIAYYTEHVSADAVHDQLAVRTICGGIVAEDPGLRDEVFFGAFTCLDLENRFATSWLAARSEAAA